MDSQVELKDTYNFIIDHFGEDKIVSRYQWIYDLMEDYINAEELQEKVYISEDILNHVIIDYFVDTYRLKDFQDIKYTHDSKIYAYMIYWLLRHKPLQIKREDAEELVFVNEKFAAEILYAYLFKEPNNVSILNSQKESMENFTETLFYFFKYRDYSAKNIEMIILAFLAGRAYQYSVDNAR